MNANGIFKDRVCMKNKPKWVTIQLNSLKRDVMQENE